MQYHYIFLNKFGDALAIKVYFITFGFHKFSINLDAPQQLKCTLLHSAFTNFAKKRGP